MHKVIEFISIWVLRISASQWVQLKGLSTRSRQNQHLSTESVVSLFVDINKMTRISLEYLHPQKYCRCPEVKELNSSVLLQELVKTALTCKIQCAFIGRCQWSGTNIPWKAHILKSLGSVLQVNHTTLVLEVDNDKTNL